MRPPAIPLINVDPYFSLWAPYDKLTDGAVRHWTGAENNVIGSVIIDGVEYGFLGKNHNKILNQVRLEITAFTTEVTFENEFITLYVKFCSPLIPDDIEVMSEPIGYMECSYESKDLKKHEVKLKLMVFRLIKGPNILNRIGCFGLHALLIIQMIFACFPIRYGMLLTL